MFFWETPSYLYIYGGKNTAKEYLNDMWKLNLAKMEWTLVNGSSPMDKPEDGFAVYHSTSNIAYLWRDTLWSFHLETNTWKDLTHSSNPKASQDSVLILDEDTIYLYGGKTESTNLGTFHSYDISSGVWTKLDIDTKPSTRWGPTVCGNTFLFGGVHEHHPYDDLWAFESQGLEQYERYFLRVTTAMSILTFVCVIVFSLIIILLVKKNKFHSI